ncbi:MAG: anaerobic sulfatase maturase [Planctomycetota bacterium]|jgi:uncharacterized protein
MHVTQFHVLAKPIGPVCNLRCEYCFYCEKEALFPTGENYRMSDEVLDAFTRNYIQSQDAAEVVFAWQGGEPTLMGLEFFEKAVRLQRKYGRGKQVRNTLQTNGILLDDEWCRFLARHGFLIGLSLDGPQDLHDRYRTDRAGRPTFDAVVRALRLLQEHSVDYNILACVTRESARRPLDVYRFFKEQGVEFIQFIPVVERLPDETAEGLGLQLAAPPVLGNGRASVPVTPWTVEPEAHGEFLTAIFDEWVRNDVGRVFVMDFEWPLAVWAGQPPATCRFSPWCGRCIVVEHDGGVYACDHYVYPEYRIGNVLEGRLDSFVGSARQVRFGKAKRDRLPRWCRECRFLGLCGGDCPKHRFASAPDGEPGLSYLCPAYKRFFARSAPYMKAMADLLAHGLPADRVMEAIDRPLIIDLGSRSGGPTPS